MKKIGVSACFMYPDMDRTVFGPKSLSYLENDMARYLARPEIMPVLIPDLEDDVLYEFLYAMDGFVFQGGTDIAPQSYGAHNPDPRWPGDHQRDLYELKIMEFAIQNQKPVLGICRGFQLLNVYFGGTLHQDIASHYDDKVQHRDAHHYDQLTHEVRFDRGNFLDHLHLDDPHRLVNTVHHQGIDGVASDLEVLAYSVDDHLIEAFQWKGAEEGKVLGVQWHPEFFHNHQGPLLDGDRVYDHFLRFVE